MTDRIAKMTVARGPPTTRLPPRSCAPGLAEERGARGGLRSRPLRRRPRSRGSCPSRAPAGRSEPIGEGVAQPAQPPEVGARPLRDPDGTAGPPSGPARPDAAGARAAAASDSTLSRGGHPICRLSGQVDLEQDGQPARSCRGRIARQPRRQVFAGPVFPRLRSIVAPPAPCSTAGGRSGARTSAGKFAAQRLDLRGPLGDAVLTEEGQPGGDGVPHGLGPGGSS